MSLAAATPADAPAIRALLEDSGLPAADLSPALLEGFLVRRDGAALIAVGGLQWTGGDALLRSVAVAPAARGGGIGEVMVAALEIRARQREAHTLYLLTTTAEAWFAALGYRRLSREHAPPGIQGTAQFAQLCPDSAVFMAKALAP